MSLKALREFYGSSLEQLQIELGRGKKTNQFLMDAIPVIELWSPPIKTSEKRRMLMKLSEQLNKTFDLITNDPYLSRYLGTDQPEANSPFRFDSWRFKDLPSNIKECAIQAEADAQKMARIGTPPKHNRRAFICALLETYLKTFKRIPAKRSDSPFNEAIRLLQIHAGYGAGNPEKPLSDAVKILFK